MNDRRRARARRRRDRRRKRRREEMRARLIELEPRALATWRFRRESVRRALRRAERAEARRNAPTVTRPYFSPRFGTWRAR